MNKKILKSCWWYEGGRCYIEPCQREKNERSIKQCLKICKKFKSKRKMLSSVIPSDKLIIVSEGRK